MRAEVAGYLEWLRVRNYSAQTVEGSKGVLHQFVSWCEERGVVRPEEATLAVLERYQRSLFRHRTKRGAALSVGSQHRRLVVVRGFFRWLARTKRIGSNPAAELEMPKLGHRLPRHVLTAVEAEAVLSKPDVRTAVGLRDRAMMETLYSTGMRRNEMIGLDVADVDGERGTVTIRQGKGKKDRVVAIGARAVEWIERYVEEARPALVGFADEGILFVSKRGGRLVPQSVTKLVAGYIEAAVGWKGSCHVFRHTCATLMLEGGADIRYIQQQLGHAKLDTTEIYTRVSIRALKAIHTATHPARVAREGEAGGGSEPDEREVAREALLEALAAEGDEEGNEDDLD